MPEKTVVAFDLCDWEVIHGPDSKLTTKPSKVKTFLMLVITALGLSGCINAHVEARVTLDVEPNGSGTFLAAMGMSRDLRDLLGSQDEDPMLAFTKSISRETDVVSLQQWSDGELEWVQSSFPFANTRELNQRMEGNEFISNFSLVKQKSLLKDRFVLNAIINPVIEDTGDNLIDPANFFDFQIIVRLPGDLIETNGYYDASSQGVSWSINGTQKQTLYAMSEVKRWTNLDVLAGTIAIIAVFFLLGSILIFAVWFNQRPVAGADKESGE